MTVLILSSSQDIVASKARFNTSSLASYIADTNQILHFQAVPDQRAKGHGR